MSRLLLLGGLVLVTALLMGPMRGLLPGAMLLDGSSRLGGPAAAPATGGPAHQSAPTSGPTAPAVIAPTGTSVALSAVPLAKASDGYALRATVRTKDGAAAGSATVRFYEIVDLFGQREMYIGTATTDGTGAASIAYLPSRVGSHQIVARTVAAGQLDAAVGWSTFESSVAAPPYVAPTRPLAAFSDRVPYAVGLVVLGVWSLIAFALLATARGVIGGARSPDRKGEPA